MTFMYELCTSTKNGKSHEFVHKRFLRSCELYIIK